MDRESYPTDLTDWQWRRIVHWIPNGAATGRPSKYSKREIVNAILYVTRNGCTWRGLPHDFPPYRIVFHWFRRWQSDGTWERLHEKLRDRVRRKEGRTPKPTAAILDSQTVKTTEQGGPRGYDAGKKTLGRKRHIVTDTLGLVWALAVTPADVLDRDGAKARRRKEKNNAAAGNSPTAAFCVVSVSQRAQKPNERLTPLRPP